MNQQHPPDPLPPRVAAALQREMDAWARELLEERLKQQSGACRACGHRVALHGYLLRESWCIAWDGREFCGCQVRP